MRARAIPDACALCRKPGLRVDGLSERSACGAAALSRWEEPKVDRSGSEFGRVGLGLGVHVRRESMSAERRPRCWVNELGGTTPPKPELSPGTQPAVNDEEDDIEVALCVRACPGRVFFWSFAGADTSAECLCATVLICACAARVDSALTRPAGVWECGM